MAGATSQRFHAAACSSSSARIVVASASVNCRVGTGRDAVGGEMTGGGGTASATVVVAASDVVSAPCSPLALWIVVRSGVKSYPRRTHSYSAHIASTH